MANPNIVAVSSIYGESLGEALTTTTTTVIMTVASNKLLKINYMQIVNDHASTTINCTVAITKADFTSDGVASGDDNAAIINLAALTPCPAGDILVIVDKPIYLMEGDNLEAGASAATGDIFISYEVIDDA